MSTSTKKRNGTRATRAGCSLCRWGLHPERSNVSPPVRDLSHHRTVTPRRTDRARGRRPGRHRAARLLALSGWAGCTPDDVFDLAVAVVPRSPWGGAGAWRSRGHPVCREWALPVVDRIRGHDAGTAPTRRGRLLAPPHPRTHPHDNPISAFSFSCACRGARPREYRLDWRAALPDRPARTGTLAGGPDRGGHACPPPAYAPGDPGVPREPRGRACAPRPRPTSLRRNAVDVRQAWLCLVVILLHHLIGARARRVAGGSVRRHEGPGHWDG